MLIIVCELMNLPTAGSQRAGKYLVIALPERITEPAHAGRQLVMPWDRAG